MNLANRCAAKSHLIARNIPESAIKEQFSNLDFFFLNKWLKQMEESKYRHYFRKEVKIKHEKERQLRLRSGSLIRRTKRRLLSQNKSTMTNKKEK